MRGAKGIYIRWICKAEKVYFIGSGLDVVGSP